uniref:30S ribosomal protein S21, chloroplastic-like n=1 Tax=Erigeron canadensis TaxID=72917 RepID=UPI001CB90E1A|nr:30S ribosomal protein S21, chloroplastic-like [Erigeron canadensis]XP_043607976.1 30S ribosomal protein S21, chloroplastic-like [Erigeron canadensis]
MAMAPPNSLLTTRRSLPSSSYQQPTAKILSSTSPPLNPLTLTIKHNPIITPITNNDIQSLVYPSLAFSNTLFFKTPYNVQVIVAPDESEESLIGRFRREVFRANVIQECKRRKFFETNQEKRKRKVRDAARRRARRRPRPQAKKEEVSRKKAVDDESDNWDQIDVQVPYCR